MDDELFERCCEDPQWAAMQIEELRAKLHAAETERNAASWQMRENAERLDRS